MRLPWPGGLVMAEPLAARAHAAGRHQLEGKPDRVYSRRAAAG